MLGDILKLKAAKKIIVCMILSVFILTNSSIYQVFAVEQPEINGSYAISIDATTGEVLYDKNSREEAYPASVTKIMTALLFLENVEAGEKITLSANAVNQVKSNSVIDLKVGEQIERDEALKIMMILSANDVAMAIAEYVSGSEEEFAKLMNNRAKELGATNTNFITPNGLHHPEHKTTAYDMALIAKEAIKNPTLLEVIGTPKATVNTSRQTVTITNPSKIHEDPDTLGGKTGYTSQAKNTLLKVDEKNGIRVINVIFGANNKVSKYNMYPDIKLISDYAINQLEKVTLVDSEKWSKTLTFMDKEVIVKAEKTLEITKKKDTEQSKYDIVFVQDKRIDDDFLYENGIQKGLKMGELEIHKNNQLITKVDVISNEDASFEKNIDEEKRDFVPFWLKIVIAIVVPILIYIGFIFVYNYKRINKRKPV